MRLPVLEGLIDLGKCCSGDSDFVLDRILNRLAGNKNSYKILDEFDLETDRTIHMRVTCHLVTVRNMGEILFG